VKWSDHYQPGMRIIPMSDLYLKRRPYDRVVDAVAAQLPPCIWTGGPDRDRAKLILGEQHNVWPKSIEGLAD
jgi:hypothetical protein